MWNDALLRMVNSPLLQIILFPGLVFAGVGGLVTFWIDRKVTARVQMRRGPPFFQPVYDIIKYFVKETCVPAGGSVGLFLAAPVIGLGSAALASTIIWRSMLYQETFVGDLIVVLYLLTMPAMAVVLGAFASRNPLASVGGSREMKLILAYELPFVLAVCVPVIKLGDAASVRLSDILLAERAAVTCPSGIIALVVGILCMQAKLTFIPFDAPEAETELSGGAYVEYSGPPLAMLKLTKAMMYFIMPTFLVVVFCGGLAPGDPSQSVGLVLGLVYWLLKYVLLVVVVVLIKNTAPRVRIDQAVRFFWGPVTIAALLAILLAFIGW